MSIITKKIAIGCDHAGVELKGIISAEFESMGIKIIDFGTNNSDSVDYPDYAEKVSQAIIKNDAEMGMLICGSGIGMSIAANRHKEIRAALCNNNEVATLSRQHNNANILVLAARFIDEEAAINMVRTFFTTEFEGGRHEKRVAKFS